MFPDRNSRVLCDGVCQWRRFDVAYPEEAVFSSTSQVLRIRGIVGTGVLPFKRDYLSVGIRWIALVSLTFRTAI